MEVIQSGAILGEFVGDFPIPSVFTKPDAVAFGTYDRDALHIAPPSRVPLGVRDQAVDLIDGSVNSLRPADAVL